MLCIIIVPSAPEIIARWMNQFASILTSFNESVRQVQCPNVTVLVVMYHSIMSACMHICHEIYSIGAVFHQ